MKYQILIQLFTVLVLIIMVHGKYHSRRKGENSRKHHQNLDSLHQNAGVIANDDFQNVPQSVADEQNNFYVHTKRKLHSKEEVNMLQNGYDHLAKSHGGRMLKKSHGQDMKKSSWKSHAIAKKQERKDIGGKVYKPTVRRVQKWLDDQQKNAQKAKRNSQSDLRRKLQTVKNDLKLQHQEHKKSSSVSKHQQLHTKNNKLKGRNFEEEKRNLNGHGAVHRMKSDHTHKIKETTKVKKGEKFGKDIHRDIPDAQMISHRHRESKRHR